jgi:hypothetical protein
VESKDDNGNVVAEPIENALHNVKTTIQNILSLTEATEYKVFLSGEGNFRYDIDPAYKISRRDARQPIYKEEIKQYLLAYHPTEVVDGCEADDALGIWLSKEGSHDNPDKCSRIIASIDKDLDQIPGWHCNFVKERVYWVDKEYGEYVYLRQLLTGDRTDDIPGIPGMGDKKADLYLGNYSSFDEAFKRVQAAYLVWIDNENDAAYRLYQNMYLLYIERMQDDLPPGLEEFYQLDDFVGLPQIDTWKDVPEPADFTITYSAKGRPTVKFGNEEKRKQKAEASLRQEDTPVS